MIAFKKWTWDLKSLPLLCFPRSYPSFCLSFSFRHALPGKVLCVIPESILSCMRKTCFGSRYMETWDSTRQQRERERLQQQLFLFPFPCDFLWWLVALKSLRHLLLLLLSFSGLYALSMLSMLSCVLRNSITCSVSDVVVNWVEEISFLSRKRETHSRVPDRILTRRKQDKTTKEKATQPTTPHQLLNPSPNPSIVMLRKNEHKTQH